MTRRREFRCQFSEHTCRGCRSTGSGVLCGALQAGGYVTVRSLGSQREVACSFLRIDGCRSEEAVNASAPPKSRVFVANGREQRVRESHALIVELDHRFTGSVTERLQDDLGVPMRRHHHVYGGPGKRRGKEQDVKGLGRQPSHAGGEQLP
jgi:hypothetical protein